MRIAGCAAAGYEQAATLAPSHQPDPATGASRPSEQLTDEAMSDWVEVGSEDCMNPLIELARTETSFEGVQRRPADSAGDPGRHTFTTAAGRLPVLRMRGMGMRKMPEPKTTDFSPQAALDWFQGQGISARVRLPKDVCAGGTGQRCLHRGKMLNAPICWSR